MTQTKPKMPAAMVLIAQKETGVHEINGTNCGPRVNEYKATTWLPADKPWPWCAAFVCWVVKEAAKHAGVEFTDKFKRPQTAGAWDFENWSLAQDRSTWTKKPHKGDIEPGDIVVFTFSHIGIAVSHPNEQGLVITIEGNTDGLGSREGGAVMQKVRKLSQIRSRIRFRV